MMSVPQDLRYGLRTLAKSPGFAAAAIATLALGIGANTAIFSVVHAVLLQPLPYPQPDRIVTLEEIPPLGAPGPVSGPNFLDWRAQARSFESLAAFREEGVNLLSRDEPRRVDSASVSEDFLQTFRVRPLRGRLFEPPDFEPGAAPAALISERLWHGAFRADPGVLGTVLSLGGSSRVLVGILPASFRYPASADLWVPLRFDSLFARTRGSHFLAAVGRLKPGTTLAGAQAEMDVISRRLARLNPGSNTGWRIHVSGLAERMSRALRPALLVLLAAVACVLLIACANVANLLLARATARRREMAIRSAVGAGRGRLVRQLFTETLAMFLLGGAAGLLVANWGIDLLLSLAPAAAVERFGSVGIDWPVAAAALALTVLASLVAGLAPAINASRLAGVDPDLRESGLRSSPGPKGERLRRALVAAEVALATVLLVGGGLMLRTFRALRSVDPGFDASRVLTLQLHLPQLAAGEIAPRRVALSRLLDRVEELPGVEAASLVLFPPMSGASDSGNVRIEGAPPPRPGRAPVVEQRMVAPRYFAAMGIPPLAGRDFTSGDDGKSPGVVVVNRAMANRFWPGQNPLGRRIAFDIIDGKPVWLPVVGLVGDVRHFGPDRAPEPEVYVPYLQIAPEVVAFFGPRDPLSLVVRAAGDPLALAASVRRAVAETTPDLPATDVRPMEALVSDAVADRRFESSMLGIFGALALTLAVVGVAGVVACAVARRGREMSIRAALGATSRDLVADALRQGAGPVGVGLAAGLAAALGASRLLASLLFGVSPTDPATYAAVAATLGAVALVAAWLPARRAARADPMIAMRSE